MSDPVKAPLESRQRLLEAAARVFAESGFRGATTRRIAEVAGVNEVTLFRLFGSKSALMAQTVQCLHPMQGIALPDPPNHVARELEEWAAAHLEAMRESRHLIRKTMAELEEHPEMSPVVCDAKAPFHDQLMRYAAQVWRPGSQLARDDMRTACTMLISALFSDALGREAVPSAYPSPPESAARKYVKAFLAMLGPVPRSRNVRPLPRPRPVASKR